jgi:hypothetical protein
LVGGKRNIKGGGINFYDEWVEVQKDYDTNRAQKLFINFIKLLSLCEDQYFIHRDSADNFYTYNPTPLRHGGHTQIQMMAVFDALITEYISRLQQLSKLDLLLKCFVYLPNLLEQSGFSSILSDLRAYVTVWFNYYNIMGTDISLSDDILSTFNLIIDKARKQVDKVYTEMPSGEEEGTDYLDTVFPHGYFVIKYAELTDAPLDTPVPANANTIFTKNTASLKGKLNAYSRVAYQPHNARAERQGGKRTAKKRCKNKRKTHKKRKY